MLLTDVQTARSNGTIGPLRADGSPRNVSESVLRFRGDLPLSEVTDGQCGLSVPKNMPPAQYCLLPVGVKPGAFLNFSEFNFYNPDPLAWSMWFQGF